MTGAALGAELIERGLDPGELPAKRTLFELVLSRFAELAPLDDPGASNAQLESTDARNAQRQSGVHAWWVPGRLEVFGKHTDYAGGRTLVCAVPRGFAVVATARAGGFIRVVDARRDQELTLATDPGRAPAPSVPYTGWRHYADVVARRLARNFPGARLGADIVLASDLPRASGMSSSSALVVGLAAALVRVAHVEDHPAWQANIRTLLDAAGYYASLENGLSYGSLSGDAGVGTHGGSEDHAAIVTGLPQRVSAFSFVPMAHLEDVRVPDAWRFVLTPCGVRSEKTGAAMDRYNRLSAGARVLLQIWNSAGHSADSLGAALRTDPDAADCLHRLVRLARIEGWTADALARRLDHFIREDARVMDGVDAFRRADALRLTQLAEQSQHDAETLLGNQIPETSELTKSARALGAFASCGFGAGFGGSVWALVDRAAAAEFAGRWHAGAFIAAPGPSLTELWR